MTIVSTAPPKPANYGEWWNRNQQEEAWYTEIFDHRPNAHRFFMEWYGDRIRRGERIQEILEVGCGRGIPYATYFKTVDYSGTDISEKEIAFCEKRYGLPPGRFFVSDVIKNAPAGQYDLVFSHAVIDHVYDINGFLRQLASATRRYLYISAYRTWLPNLPQHRYEWTEQVTCYHNDISPAETRLVLAECGFATVEIFPVFSGRWDIGHPMETVIIAERR